MRECPFPKRIVIRASSGVGELLDTAVDFASRYIEITTDERMIIKLISLFVGFFTSSSTTRLYIADGPQDRRLTIVSAATHETEWGDHGHIMITLY